MSDLWTLKEFCCLCPSSLPKTSYCYGCPLEYQASPGEAGSQKQLWRMELGVKEVQLEVL